MSDCIFSQWALSIHPSGVLAALFGSCRLVPLKTAAISACSVYTIQLCITSRHLMQSHTRRVHVCLAVTSHRWKQTEIKSECHKAALLYRDAQQPSPNDSCDGQDKFSSESVSSRILTSCQPLGVSTGWKRKWFCIIFYQLIHSKEVNK